MNEIILTNEVLKSGISLYRNKQRCGEQLRPIEEVSVLAMEELLKCREQALKQMGE